VLGGVGSSCSKLAFLSVGADACRVSSTAHLERSWSWLLLKPSSTLVLSPAVRAPGYHFLLRLPYVDFTAWVPPQFDRSVRSSGNGRVIQFTCRFLVRHQNCSSASVAVRASFVLLLVSEALHLSSLWSWHWQASSSFGLGQGGSFLLSVIHSMAQQPGAAQFSPTARSCCLDPDF
jgi:hypothetical protein